MGLSYYRLVQVDLDGTSTPYHAVAVELRTDKALTVFPVPFQDGFTVLYDNEYLEEVALFNTMGQRIAVPWQGSGDRLLVDTRQLPPGRYIVQVRSASGTLQQAILKAP
jgi:hypothetical protein